MEVEAKVSSPSRPRGRPRGRRTVNRPQNRYLDEITSTDQSKPKRNKRSRRGFPPDIKNDSEKWKLTDLQRTMLENSSRHLDPSEYVPSVYDCILQQRAIVYAIENELRHGRRRDGIYLLMATNSVAEMQNRRFSSMDRLEFIEEMEALKERVNVRLREEWMFWGLRASENDIAQDNEHTLEQANARRVKEEVGLTENVDENGGHEAEAGSSATEREEAEASREHFEAENKRFVKLRLTLKKREDDM